MASLVIGGSGKVGGYIVKHLVQGGETPFALSRDGRASAGVNWIIGDLQGRLKTPAVDIIFCTANSMLFADALPRMITPQTKRVVVFTTTSVMTKMDSEIETERKLLEGIAAAERRIQSICEHAGIGWTILRPTLVYDEGKDRNISRLAQVIRKFGFMPVVGAAEGLRQPVHAEDLAIAAVSASRSIMAINKTYILAGTETISYAEMVGRIFDGVGKRRYVLHIPALLWRAVFKIAKPFLPGFNEAMGVRMTKDMVFDSTWAQREIGWAPREFRPKFQ